MNEQSEEEKRIDIIGSNGGDGEHYSEQEVEKQYVTGVEIHGAIKLAQEVCHQAAVQSGWWNDLETGEDMRGKRNVGELLCLVHSEISEAMEGHHNGLMDDKLPHRIVFEVELADALIRIFDLAGGYDLDLPGAFVEKLFYNQSRADHKPEIRREEGGKAY